MAAKSNPEELIVADRAAWRRWLDENENRSDGVRLVLAKKGVTDPTSLSYDEALLEALCSGWIDGRRNSRDEATFFQHLLPRRPRSNWSLRNVGLVKKLIEDGLMKDRGFREIELAQADGRWDRAYPGVAVALAPDDLLKALSADPEIFERFEALSKSARYPHILGVLTAQPERRAARIQAVIRALS